MPAAAQSRAPTVTRNAPLVVAVVLLLTAWIAFRWWQLCQHPATGNADAFHGAPEDAPRLGVLPAPSEPPEGSARVPRRVRARLRAAHERAFLVRVLTYNTMLLPSPAAPSIVTRARAIGSELGAAVRDGFLDVIALQEVVDPSATAALLDAARFPWCAAPLVPSSMMRMNGGVLLAAATPPILLRTHIYASGAPRLLSWDGMIGKGVVHAAWMLPHGRGQLHVYASHTQSPAEEHGVREAQIAEWRDFVSAYGHVPARDTVLLCGDFNFPLDDARQLASLGVLPPHWVSLNETDPDQAVHARKTWDAWSDRPQELLDGVLRCVACPGAHVRSARSSVLRVRALSDHNAVVNTLQFEK